MNSSILETIGIDPAIILIVILVLIVILFIISITMSMKYSRLKASYASFMRGKDAKTLEESFRERFNELDNLSDAVKDNRQSIKQIREKMQSNYQKVGICKYDAFNEMGGKLSFAITLLDANDNGWILNSMHSREGCYNYVKEIVKGESYIELSKEESESLEKAIYQESFRLD